MSEIIVGRLQKYYDNKSHYGLPLNETISVCSKENWVDYLKTLDNYNIFIVAYSLDALKTVAKVTNFSKPEQECLVITSEVDTKDFIVYVRFISEIKSPLFRIIINLLDLRYNIHEPYKKEVTWDSVDLSGLIPHELLETLKRCNRQISYGLWMTNDSK